MGPSGSGKTTLLNMLSTIDKPTHGTILLDGMDITKAGNKELSNIRKDKIGFIFQDYNLLDTMTLQDNIALPLSLKGVASSTCIQKTKELAAMFGLEEHLKKYPYQLSGGQKQRGAACRALISDPKILFADEPTGALDYNTGKQVLKLLQDTCRKQKVTVIVITHNLALAPMGDKVIHVKNGRIESIEINENPMPVERIEY